jgi:enoyl-[acyl-carrier protein] reductase II
VATPESSGHAGFKDRVIHSNEGDTKLAMKQVTPVRLLINDFAKQIHEAESAGATPAQLIEILGRGRAKKGMFEGELEQGELEIGQVSSLIREIKPAADIVIELMEECEETIQNLSNRFI